MGRGGVRDLHGMRSGRRVRRCRGERLAGWAEAQGSGSSGRRSSCAGVRAAGRRGEPRTLRDLHGAKQLIVDRPVCLCEHFRPSTRKVEANEHALRSRKKKSSDSKGLRQLLSLEEQVRWLEGEASPRDADERAESVELRFKYLPRYHKLLGRPVGQEVLKILESYWRSCIPVPRRTEREYWSVSCLPSSSDKPLVRATPAGREPFTLYADDEGVRGRFILHLSDFTTDGSTMPEQVNEALIEGAAARPGRRRVLPAARGRHVRDQPAGRHLARDDDGRRARAARHSAEFRTSTYAHEPGAGGTPTSAEPQLASVADHMLVG